MLSKSEIHRLHVIQQAVEGNCSVRQAADRLRLSTRRIKELKKEFRLHGVPALIHGNTKHSSPKRLDPALVQQILLIRQQPHFCDSNFLHFQELLVSCHDIHISYSSLHRILSAHSFSSPKKRRRSPKLHKSRERKLAAGTMLQADATPFPWFGGSESFALHGFIDDATGMLTGLYLCKNECLLGYLEVLRQTLTNFGIPQSLYPDRYSVFFVNPKKQLDLSIEEQLSGLEKKVTQFGRILDRLGIDMFPAHSPEAKGRIERLWNTLQSRLPVELALAGIHDLPQANLFLQDFIPRFNAQFSVPPKDSFSAFVPVPSSCDLDRLLCAEFPRVLSKGSTVSLSNHRFFIDQNRFPAKTQVTLLLSEKHGLRALLNGAFYPIRAMPNPVLSDAVPCSSDLPIVVAALLKNFLLKDAKAA